MYNKLIPLLVLPVWLSLLAISGCDGVGSGTSSEAVVEVAPDFDLTLLEGGNFKLSDHKGKPVVVNFFASWCVPCGAESPVMEKMYQSYLSEGVSFVGVAVNDTESKAREFIEKYGLTFPSGLDDSGEIKDAFGVYGMPTTYFIDGNGMISYLHPGGVTERLMEHEIDKLLATEVVNET
ncbi:MAG: TlpA family protein disulfide reductase [Halieaceae bacterium]|jgi:cytochrome c biogenesis protein CcmG, thiol:disulfide interchange protein DsbE|nr:TlpA family protein disulfide reductase [Halieaceae bacterium]